jgi:hypothetical protein
MDLSFERSPRGSRPSGSQGELGVSVSLANFAVQRASLPAQGSILIGTRAGMNQDLEKALQFRWMLAYIQGFSSYESL